MTTGRLIPPHPSPLRHPTDRLIGDSPAIRALRDKIRHLAIFDTVGNPDVPTLLLHGETGTGKGLVARVMHDSGPRAPAPFIDVNCAAIPETLLEAELFGFEAGAFTDAKRAKPGLFEAASGGTLFLDEIDSLPAPLQAKFLTVIEEKRVRRVGAVVERPVDVKLIAATQADLAQLVAAGRFRPDLYHRLAVVLLGIPTLRERGGDIVLLGHHFLARYAGAHGLSPKRLSVAAEEWLRTYSWPGNIRELSHLMERATLLGLEPLLTPDTVERLCLPRPGSPVPAAPKPRDGEHESPDERARIGEALSRTGWNVVRAARLLGMSRSALRHRMRRYGMNRAGETETPPSRRAEASEHQPRARVVAAPGEIPTQSPAWERKPVAVLAIDVTWPEASGLDAPRYEPWTVATRWEETITEKVRGFGGVLVQRAPSLLTAAFGIPQTLDELPQRAVQAALTIRQLVKDAPSSARGEPAPEVRQTIHWGEVVVDVQASDPAARVLAVGQTLATPVRLLGHAAPGDVLVSPQLGRLVQGWFELDARRIPLGGGQPNEVGAYAVMALDPRRQSLGGFAARVHSRFVGRERELAALHELLARAEAGRGQVVGIVGEPGVGKSRLLYEFRQRLSWKRVLSLEGQSVSYGSTIPYLPVLDLLRAYFQIEERDDPQRIREKVTSTLLTLDDALGAARAPFFALLNLPVEDMQWQALDPSQRRQQMLDALKRLVLRESRVQPVLLVLEGLHWIDAETQVFLESLIESLPAARVLLLVTYRPDYQHRWGNRTYYTQLRLDPLPPESAQELLDALLGDDTGRAPLKRLLIEWTQGNPFFLEESVQTLVETGVLVGERGAYRVVQALPTMQIPPTVQAVLAARIDRLPPREKRLLQCAAVIGNNVPLSLLQAVVEQPAEALRQGLSHLQAAEFLYETGHSPDPEYTFKHALTHDVAYGSLTTERRRALHARIVESLESLYADRLADQVDRLAHHALRGEVWGKAVTNFGQAGARAAARSANREAVACFEQALVGVQHVPEGREKLEQAIDLRSHLGNALVPLGEFRRIIDHLREAERLAEELGDRRRLARVSSFMSFCVWMTGDHDRAVALGQRALAIADTFRDFPLQVRTNFYIGQAYNAKGDYRNAIDVLRRTVVSLEAELRRKRLGMAGLPAVFSRSWLAWCRAELGEFAEGAAMADEGMRIAEEADHPFSLAVACSGIGILSLRKGDLHRAISVLERGLQVCQTWHIPLMFPWVASALGYAYALAGRVDEAVPVLEQAVDQAAAVAILGRLSIQVAWLGEVHLLAGRVSDAARFAQHALDLSREHKERGHEAWTLRLLAEVAARRDPPEVERADAFYHEALALADELGMRPLSAHSHLGLGTLYGKANRVAPARLESSAAIELFRSMEMTFWLAGAEAGLGSLNDS
jgi:DNA-binding NtrC family response regulator/tetratricopeptide (TPR) repeat protein